MIVRFIFELIIYYCINFCSAIYINIVINLQFKISNRRSSIVFKNFVKYLKYIKLQRATQMEDFPTLSKSIDENICSKKHGNAVTNCLLFGNKSHSKKLKWKPIATNML